MGRIRAKYDGVCMRCEGKIIAGDVIEWDKDTGALHADCADDLNSTNKSPVKPVQAGTTARYNPPPAEKARETDVLTDALKFVFFEMDQAIENGNVYRAAKESKERAGQALDKFFKTTQWRA